MLTVRLRLAALELGNRVPVRSMNRSAILTTPLRKYSRQMTGRARTVGGFDQLSRFGIVIASSSTSVPASLLLETVWTVRVPRFNFFIFSTDAPCYGFWERTKFHCVIVFTSASFMSTKQTIYTTS